MRVEVDVGERERRALVGKDDGGRGVERRKRYLSPMGSIEMAFDGGQVPDGRFCECGGKLIGGNVFIIDGEKSVVSL